MKVLWISSTPSHSLTNEESKHVNTIARKILDGGNELTFLLCCASRDTSVADLDKMRKEWSSFFFYEHQKTAIDRLDSDLDSVFCLMRSMPFDVVCCDYELSYKAFPAFSKETLKVLYFQRPLEIAEDSSLGADVVRTSFQCNNVIFDQSDLILVVTDEDKRYFETFIQKTILVVGQEGMNVQVVHDFLRAIATKSIRHVRKKRVLLVTDVPFWEPGLGSHSRILTLCETLKRHANLTIFFFGTIGAQSKEHIERAGFAGIVFSCKLFEKKGTRTTDKSTFPLLPGLEKWRHGTFTRELTRFTNSVPRFDVVMIEYIWLAYTLDAVKYPTLTVLDAHDMMAFRDYRFALQGAKAGVSITLNQELGIFERFNIVLAIQREELEFLAGFLQKAIPLYCPHGLTIPAQDSSNIDQLNFRIGFIAGNSEANWGAINWFLHQVWPAISSLPMHLHIFGKICDRFNQLPKNVTLHGLVDNCADVYSYCNVMINPVFLGGGIKIKSVEALAYGKPLITSPEGAVGIDEPQSSGVYVARSRSEFIDGILRLFCQPSLCESMGAAARNAAEVQFSEKNSFLSLIEVLEAL